MRTIDRHAPLYRKFRIVSAAARWMLLAIPCAALLFLNVQRSAAQAGDSHASPAKVVGTPDTIIPETQRKMTPDFTLTDAQGQTITLSAYKGKVVLLDFWATWCGGCKLEIPWYIEFEKTYRSKGLAVIGVSMDDEGMKIVKPFLTQKNIEYPVVIGNEALANQYNLTSMPMTLLIDHKGRIAVSHSGVVDKDNFESHIKQLLK